MIYSYGDTFNIVEVFDPGDTVNVDVLDTKADTLIVSAGTATESSNMPGVFIYTFTHTFSSENGLVYSISNGKYTKKGFILVGGENIDKNRDTNTTVGDIDTTTTNTYNKVSNDLSTKTDVINASQL